MTKLLMFTSLLFVSCFLFFSNAEALDIVDDPGKQWEITLSPGYKDFTTKGVDSAPSLGIRVQKRIKYPFLLGIGVEGSLIKKSYYAELNIPFSWRIGMGPLKLDAVVAPGGAYAENSDLEVKRIIGVITAGFEIKTFIKEGTSIGIGAYYSYTTDSRFKNVRGSLNIGF